MNREELCTISLQVQPEELLSMTETHFEKIGKMAADALRRQQAQALCERDGHPGAITSDRHGTVCSRCMLSLADV